MGKSLLEVIVIGELLAGHDALVACKERHSRFSGYYPFLHLAVGFAGMVDEAGDGTSSGIDDHVLVEHH